MDALTVMLDPLHAVLSDFGHFMPRLLMAALILAIGWLLAKGFRFGAVKALRAINFHVITEKAGIDGVIAQSGARHDTADLLGMLVYWALILLSLMVAFNTLGLSEVTSLVERILLFVPNVIVSVLILALGAYFARFIATAVEAYCRNVGITDGPMLGQFASYAVLAFVVLTALDQLAITGELVRDTFLIVVGGVVLALALAFGIGGQKWAAEVIDRWRSRSDSRGTESRT